MSALHVPDGPPLFFAKTPVYMKAGTLATTVELAVDSTGYLAWVPACIWTSGGGIDLTLWMASRIVFHGCPHGPSTYLGGLLSVGPGICLTLRVSQHSMSAQRRTLHLGTTVRC